MRGIDPRLDVGLDQHDSRILEWRRARRDADRDRILAHERIVEPRRGQSAEHRHRHLERHRFGVVEPRSEEHTSELQSLMRISYAVFCLKKKQKYTHHKQHYQTNTSLKWKSDLHQTT